MNTNPDNSYVPLLKDESISTINTTTSTTTGTSVATPSQFNNFDAMTSTNNLPAVDSVLTNFFNGANTKQSSITKLTNRHTTSKKPRKKIGANIRACDACALKKVKCDIFRPCNHCRTNNIACTQNRERKKSGPKTMTRKTLESINNLSDVIEKNTNGGIRPGIGKRLLSKSFSRSPSNELMDEDVNIIVQQGNGDQIRSKSHSISPELSNGSTATPNSNIKQESPFDQQQGQQQGQFSELKSQYPNVTVGAGNSGAQSTLGSTVNLSAISIEDYIVTPYHLIENLNLIGEEPSIYELIKPLSTPTVIEHYNTLVDFLKTSYPDRRDRETGYNPRHDELNFVEHHDNSLYLSKLLLILTLNQIVAELLIKLKKQKFKGFKKYPKKYLMFRPFKHFKNLCHFKVLEIFTLVEKNFIVPPTIPQNRINNNNNNNSGTNCVYGQNVNNNSSGGGGGGGNYGNSQGNLQLFLHLNQYEIYYNLSLTCIQLCNYYHILNLTNTLNSTNLSSNNYGNEAQEHQKILFLHRAITYFQLINLRSNDKIIPVEELYELLYSFERYYIVLSSYNYNINVTRNNAIILQLHSINFKGSGYIYEMMEVLANQGLINDLCYRSNFNITLEYSKPIEGYYYKAKELIKNLAPKEAIHQIIENIILFKVLLVKPLSFNECKQEIVEIINNLNYLLETNNNDIFKVKLSNYQVLQPILHCLKIFLEIKTIEVKSGYKSNNIGINDQMILVKFSDNLILHFPFFNNINKLIRAHKILNNWFLNLSEIKKDDEQQQQQQQMEIPIRPEHSQPKTPAQLPTLPEVTQLQTVPEFQAPVLTPIPNPSVQLLSQQQQSPPQLHLQQNSQFSLSQVGQALSHGGGIDGTGLLSYDILPLTPNFHQTNLQLRIASQIDLQGLLDFDSLMQNNSLNTGTNANTGTSVNTTGNNINIGQQVNTSISPPIPVLHQGHQADDEEDDEGEDGEEEEEEEEEEGNGFMSIIPRNQHGHKFLNGFDNNNNNNTPTVNNNNQQQQQQQPTNNVGGGNGSEGDNGNTGRSSESFSNFFNW